MQCLVTPQFHSLKVLTIYGLWTLCCHSHERIVRVSMIHSLHHSFSGLFLPFAVLCFIHVEWHIRPNYEKETR